MSAIHIDNRLVHYEVVGRRGAPMIFLHSWLGSWRYWLPTMEHVSERYRTFAIDFWGLVSLTDVMEHLQSLSMSAWW